MLWLGASSHPALDNCPIFSDMLWPYQPTERFGIGPFQVLYKTWDSVATRDAPLEKKVEIKHMMVSVLKNIVSMTKRGSDIQTD